MKVFIYCGVSGAGKSTLISKSHPGAHVCSADQFFVIDGEYRFDASKLGDAHGACLKRFVRCLQDFETCVVVDNTNTTIAEIAPYAALALAYGYELQIVTCWCDPTVAHARNRHGVPLAAVTAMHDRLKARVLPPWWQHSDVPQMEASL